MILEDLEWLWEEVRKILKMQINSDDSDNCIFYIILLSFLCLSTAAVSFFSNSCWKLLVISYVWVCEFVFLCVCKNKIDIDISLSCFYDLTINIATFSLFCACVQVQLYNTLVYSSFWGILHVVKKLSVTNFNYSFDCWKLR